MSDLREHAGTDPVTGLGDRGAFAAALERARRRSAVATVVIRVERPLTSDDRAHTRTMLALAATLSGVLRTGDELFRIGGDAFAALVSVTEDADAEGATARLRAAAAGAAPVTVGRALPGATEPAAAVLARATAHA